MKDVFKVIALPHIRSVNPTLDLHFKETQHRSVCALSIALVLGVQFNTMDVFLTRIKTIVRVSPALNSINLFVGHK
jgi:hypothetical protein